MVNGYSNSHFPYKYNDKLCIVYNIMELVIYTIGLCASDRWTATCVDVVMESFAALEHSVKRISSETGAKSV